MLIDVLASGESLRYLHGFEHRTIEALRVVMAAAGRGQKRVIVDLGEWR